MRVALTQLLRRAKPDRLLIEPTGLGHPKEVLQTLCDDSFQSILTIQKIVTLVDARHLSDSRYTEHETFQQQIAIADVIVGNKQDLYTNNDKAALKAYLQQHSLDDVKLIFAEQGSIEPSLLDGPKTILPESMPEVSLFTSQTNHEDLDTSIPECGFIKALNQGEGFMSVGWRFSSQFEFDRNKLFAFLSGINAERLKATFITNDGSFGYNLTQDALTEIPFESFDESRIEIIAGKRSDDWESDLFNCMSSGDLTAHTSQ